MSHVRISVDASIHITVQVQTFHSDLHGAIVGDLQWLVY